ncbi:hypothetical protein ZYGR_0BA01140 [Zygosaccharomyces rouxii]|uniref:Uncharacterized protein n=1 Tax=Zygosaccharomyces rouxii TaxID=4956 RepID=A0A1Q3AKD3_ZYGRO|nr:hypothetical protein ZYGR_0BA01140 [Zygosaccharomyces rouxii]
MGFFHNNSVIEFLHQIVRKPSTIMMWLFTGVVVASTTYLLISPPPSQDRDAND